MPISDSNLSYIDPKLILIGDRQRTETNTGDLKPSIARYGILNPIIVRGDYGAIKGDDGNFVGEIHLVAGHRQLTCALELNLASVPVRFYETLDPVELKVIELEENIKREELPWRDRCRAIGELHALKRAEDSTWTEERTGELISYGKRSVGRFLTIYRNLDNPAISTADTLVHALGILERIAERRSAAIVEALLRGPTPRNCTCPPGEAPIPCQHKYALSECTAAAEALIDANRSNPTFSSIRNADFTTRIEDVSGGFVGLEPPGISGPPTPVPAQPQHSTPPAPPNPIQVVDFLLWAPAYSGPKFNLIHADFPYGVHAADATIEHYENTKQLYDQLTDCLVANLDKILSYSAHVMFWLNFEYYEETKTKLRSAGLNVINRPLIWVKSDSRGAAPGVKGTMPRHAYEIALLAHRGGRPLVRQGTDAYVAPTVTNPLHATQKPEPMLRHFLSMLVDSVTDMLDPTAGSGSAIRAAEELGARSTLGLELNPEYASAANAATFRARDERNNEFGYMTKRNSPNDQYPPQYPAEWLRGRGRATEEFYTKALQEWIAQQGAQQVQAAAPQLGAFGYNNLTTSVAPEQYIETVNPVPPAPPTTPVGSPLARRMRNLDLTGAKDEGESS